MPRSHEAPQQVYVQPGESHLLRRPAVIRTVLGSCVGITFWSRQLRIGALCHPMMPTLAQSFPVPATDQAGRRYVDFAIQEMARQLDALGVQRQELEVKLFGGGDVLPVNSQSTLRTIGDLNCESALQTLEAEGLTITASSLGGTCGVQIQFDTRTGEVLLRRLG